MRILKAIADLVPSILIITCNMGCSSNPVHPSEGSVRIEKTAAGFALVRNNEPFLIRGVAGHQNLALLQSIGGNTIRTYDTLGLKAILDEAHQNNLVVIAGIALPKSREDWFYGTDSLIVSFDKELRRALQRYKNHPALLMWCLGNEPNFYDFFNFRFSAAYNKFLKTLRESDPHHPVAMAVANFSDREILNLKTKIHEIDLLVINTFGRLPQLENDMSHYQWLWSGPFIIGEFGINGPWETTTTAWQVPIEPDDQFKAARLKEMFHQLPVDNQRFLGALAFYWGQRQEATHTWFNFFSGENEMNESVFALAELWDEPLPGNKPPIVTHLKIDDQNMYNHFLFHPNSIHTGSITLSDPDNDSLEVEWTLRPDDWFFEKGNTPVPIEGSIIASGRTHVKFRAPSKPGPFRLFVKVSDREGHFATTNMPFYVVQ